jgi:hypothetical protein
MFAAPGNANLGAYGSNADLPGTQSVKLPAPSHCSQNTKNGSFYSESRPEVDIQTFV